MLPVYVRRFLLAVSVASLVACGGSDDPPAAAPIIPVDPTLSDIQAKILTPTCATAGCHDGTATDNKLNLTAGKTYGQTVGIGSEKVANATLVTAGDPAKSLMYTLLSAGQGNANKMPKAGTLPENQKEAIRLWIANGANND